jgi:hypothetical protein
MDCNCFAEPGRPKQTTRGRFRWNQRARLFSPYAACSSAVQWGQRVALSAMPPETQ